METSILPLDEFEQLEREEKIRLLNEWKETYSAKKVQETWELKNPMNYYSLLRKYNIYDEVVRKSDKFMGEGRINKTNRRFSTNSLNDKVAPAENQHQYEQPGVSIFSSTSSTSYNFNDQFTYSIEEILRANEASFLMDTLGDFLKERGDLKVEVSVSLKFVRY
ncbi:hypothetical protein P4H65_26910 [Paenibacillus chitinolyticus]|uniref:hypothetical protein n=1 Tax=Paenibacillus chitinolyticus TaxID=79263 RepID=UPI002DB9DCCC|nr:hypothetical protein [Paenibacillus chitinolyticus]MEC0249416.1 hypothetical protein [Paenibacillus chitinolyticus]